MENIKTQEELIFYLINLIGERFPQSAILKGGMSLRLFDSPRYTNDIDYIFVPFKSKKDILQDILNLLDEVNELTYTYSMNSKALRIKINYNNILTQIEASVSGKCESMPMSTASLGNKYNQLGRIIPIMDLAVSMSNKLAAWNERQLIRDLYDIQFYYLNLKTLPNMDILLNRLKKISSTAKNKNPKQMSLADFIEKLKNKAEQLTSKDMDEMKDYLPINEVIGLEYKLKSNLIKLCEELEKSTFKDNNKLRKSQK